MMGGGLDSGMRESPTRDAKACNLLNPYNLNDSTALIK